MYGSDFDMGPLVTLFFADNYNILEYIVSSTNNRPLRILECLDVQQHSLTQFFQNTFTKSAFHGFSKGKIRHLCTFMRETTDHPYGSLCIQTIEKYLCSRM